MQGNNEPHLYEEIAGETAALIDAGTLAPGDRLPSVRKLSRERGVGVQTALRAYRLLEDRGLVVARPRSGFYVRSRPGQPKAEAPSATEGRSWKASEVSVAALVEEVLAAASNPEIVPLGAAVPGPELLPGEALGRALRRVSNEEGAKLSAYQLPQGTERLRRLVARRALLWGGSARAEDVVVTTGCMEALALSLESVTDPGDVVAVESPTYYGIVQLLERLGLRALELPTDPSEGVRPADVEHAIEQRKERGDPVRALVLMPTFQNPLGALMPEEHKKALARLAAEHEVPLVEDDLYGDLYFGPSRPRPVKAFDSGGGWVLHCGSFSKTLAPGYRVGWVLPGRFRESVLRRKHASTLATSTPAQKAVAEFLSGSGYDRHLRRLRGAFRENTKRAAAAVTRFFPAGTKVSRPQGGFVLWVELPEGADATALFKAAFAEGISLAPGPVFSPSAGGLRRFIRLSCGSPWSDRMEEAVRCIGTLVRKQLEK